MDSCSVCVSVDRDVDLVVVCVSGDMDRDSWLG